MLANAAIMELPPRAIPQAVTATDDLDLPLVLRIQQGDGAAFEELYGRYQQPITRMVANIVRYPEVVPDLVQEIFTKVYFAMEGFTPGLPFRPWLYRVATNYCVDYLRKRKRQPPQVSTTSDTGEDHEWLIQDPNASVLQHLVSSDLAGKLLLDLKPRDRMLLVMKEIQEMSLEEIGQVTHMGASAVKVALFRARKRMLDQYKSLYKKSARAKREAGH
ncbi:MAG TPA: sigma-70 family RNA polymerase sigma factor [Terriglobales bacterium]|nr:sigma-70 family RNA polymerase sigma factor [Terriglobales bacterium]